MTERPIERSPRGWDADARRRLLTGIDAGVWSLSGAARRFCLDPNTIIDWRRTNVERRASHDDSARFADYVELL